MPTLDTLKKVQASLTIADITLEVLTLDGEEKLSHGFFFELTAKSPHPVTISPSETAHLSLSITSPRLQQRDFAGVIESVHQQDNHRYYQYRIHFASPLLALKKSTRPRRFIGKSLPQVINQLFCEQGFDKNHLYWPDEPRLPSQPLLTQAADETTLAFIHRLLAGVGYFFRLGYDENYKTYTIHFFSSNHAIPKNDSPQFTLTNAAGLMHLADSAALFDVRLTSTRRPNRIEVSAIDLHTPNQLIEGYYVDSPAKGQVMRVKGPKLTSTSQANAYAAIVYHALCTEKITIVASSHHLACHSGQWAKLLCQFDSSLTSGDYFITAIRHHYKKHPSGKDAVYVNQLSLIAAEYEFKLPIKEDIQPRESHSAVIEATSTTPCLDGLGRYYYRCHYQIDSHQPTKNSPPTLRLQPYAGPGVSEAAGLHFPLSANAEVMIGYLDNQLDSAIILSSLTNQENSALTNHQQPWLHTLRTSSGHFFEMSDKTGSAALRLGNKANQLQMLAKKSLHQYKFSAMKSFQLTAAGNILLQTNSQAAIETKASSKQLLTDSFQQRSKQGELHYQADNKFSLIAENSYQLTAKRNIELTGKAKVQLTSDKRWQCKSNEDLVFSTNTHSLTIDGNHLTLQAKAAFDMNAHSSGLKLSPSHMHIKTTHLQTNAPDGLQLNGEIHYLPAEAPLNWEDSVNGLALKKVSHQKNSASQSKTQQLKTKLTDDKRMILTPYNQLEEGSSIFAIDSAGKSLPYQVKEQSITGELLSDELSTLNALKDEMNE